MQEQGSNNVIVTSAHRDVLRHNSQDNTSKNIFFFKILSAALIPYEKFFNKALSHKPFHTSHIPERKWCQKVSVQLAQFICLFVPKLIG